nr:hypothetical protein [Candidatus Sigynarchaeota archaeon]
MNGEIYGAQVTTGTGCEIQGTIVSKSDVIIGRGSFIFGYVVATLSITCGEDVEINQDLFASKIILGDKCKINGCIFAEESIIIGNGCTVDGIVECKNGHIIIGNDCHIYDVMSEKGIKIGRNANIDDEVVVSRNGPIMFSDVILEARNRPLKELVNVMQFKINDAIPTSEKIMKRNNGDVINNLVNPLYHFRNMELGVTPIHESVMETRERKEQFNDSLLSLLDGSVETIKDKKVLSCPKCGGHSIKPIAEYLFQCDGCDSIIQDDVVAREVKSMKEFILATKKSRQQ